MSNGIKNLQPVTHLFSIAYFPPTEWFARFISGKSLIETYDYFEKQSYRNRCEIQSAEGKFALSIPIQKPAGTKPPISKVEIDYSENWQQLHKRAIEAAYRKSPFYEYYIDAFEFVFAEKSRNLFELNIRIIDTLCYEMELNINYELTTCYLPEYVDVIDCRTQLHPKRNMNRPDFLPQKYTQVFFDKFSFIPNLSILDLLFNEGPQAKLNLINSVIK